MDEKMDARNIEMGEKMDARNKEMDEKTDASIEKNGSWR